MLTQALRLCQITSLSQSLPAALRTEMEQMACGIIEGQRQVSESLAAPPRWQLAQGQVAGRVNGLLLEPLPTASAGPRCHCTSRADERAQ